MSLIITEIGGGTVLLWIAFYLGKVWSNARITKSVEHEYNIKLQAKIAEHNIQLEQLRAELAREQQKHSVTFIDRHKATTVAFQLLQQYKKVATDCVYRLISDNNQQMSRIELSAVHQAQFVFLEHLKHSGIHIPKPTIEKLNQVGLLLDHLTFLAKMYSHGTRAQSFSPNEIGRRLEEIDKIQESIPAKMDALHEFIQKDLGIVEPE